MSTSASYCTPHAMHWGRSAQKVSLRSFKGLREGFSPSEGAGGVSSHHVGVVIRVTTGDSRSLVREGLRGQTPKVSGDALPVRRRQVTDERHPVGLASELLSHGGEPFEL